MKTQKVNLLLEHSGQLNYINADFDVVSYF